MTSPRARADASRAAVADELDASLVQLARSLRQMIRAGQPYAMVPPALASPALVDLVLDELIAVEGAADGRFGNLCAALDLSDGSTAVWVCLRARCPARDPSLVDAAHAWPALEVRRRAATALDEQVDPIARIERRVAFALDPSTHPLLVTGMPTA